MLASPVRSRLCPKLSPTPELLFCHIRTPPRFASMPKPSPRSRLTSPAPQTPSPSPLSRSLSPSPSPSPSRQGPAESTFQRSFRGILRNFETIYKNWNILHKQGAECLIKLAAAKKPTDDLSIQIINVFQKMVRIFLTYSLQVKILITKQARQCELLKTVAKHLEHLLQDMADRRGLEAAFEEPLFLTWSLSRLRKMSFGLVVSCSRVVSTQTTG